jgi:hypothetical protein
VTPIVDAAQQAKLEAIGGGALMTTPVWAMLLHDISLWASTIAAVCGAILGIHAVYRLWRREKH